jgi:hypothetical protein
VPIPDEDVELPPSDALFNNDLVKEFWGAMRVAMDPMEMGAAVVQAIKDNQPHICTHLEFLDEVRQRNRDLEAAFPTDQIVPEGRARFENSRREASTALLTMPAKD